MRLIGLLVTLAVVGVVIYMYLQSANINSANGVQTKPAEYVNQAKQGADAIDKAMQKQQDLLDRARK